MTDARFQRFTGLTRPDFARLEQLVTPHLPQGLSTNGQSLLPVERLLVFLNWARTGCTNLQGAYNHGISEGSHSNCIDTVIDAMFDNVVDQLIVLPDEQEARREADLFHQASGFQFPRIAFAAIDGTHVLVSTYFH